MIFMAARGAAGAGLERLAERHGCLLAPVPQDVEASTPAETDTSRRDPEATGTTAATADA